MNPDLQAQIDAYKQKYAGTGVLSGDPRQNLAGMMGQSALAGGMPYMPTQPAAQPHGHGMLDWIPGLTGALGGILGGVAGTAVAPVAGTAVGGIGGAGLGQAAGKFIEDKLTGDQVNGGDIAKQGLYGAGGALVGGLVGKGVGALIGKGSSALSGAIDNRASQQALENLTGELSGVPTKTLQQNKLGDVVGLFNKMGLSPTVDNFGSAANAVTGENGAVNGIKNQLISQAGPVDVNGFMGTVDNALSKATMLNNSQKANIGQLLQRELDNTVHGGYQSLDALNGSAHPENVFDAIKNINSFASPLNGSMDPVAQATQGVYRAAAGHLQDALYNGSGANALAAAYKVTPEDLLAISKATGGHPGLTNYIVGGLNDAKSIGDIRSLEAPFVGAGQIARAAGNAAQDITRNSADAAATVGAGGVLNTARGAADVAGLAAAPFTGGVSAVIPAADVAVRALKSPALLDAAEAVGNKVGGATDLIGSIANSPMGKALGIAGDQLGAANLAAGGAPGAALTGATASAQGATPPPGNDPNSAAGTDFSSPQSALGGTDASGNPLDPTANQNAQTATPASGFTNEELAQALHNDIVNNGGRNSTKIAQLMRFNQLAERQNLPKFSSYQQQQYAQLQNAQEGMSTLGGLYKQAGGGQGAIGGGLTELGTKIPFVQNSTKESAAKAYNGQMDEVAATLARVLGGGGGQSGIQKIQALRAQLPSLTDSPQAAAMKLTVLNQRLHAAVQNIITAPSSNVPGMDANFGNLIDSSGGSGTDFTDPSSALAGFGQ